MSGTSTGSSSRRRPALPVAPPPVPEGPAEVAAALAGIGLLPTRRRGQSFLTDPFVADAEAALVERPAEARVVEIGPGLGILTAALLRRGYANLAAVELDPKLAERLERQFAGRVEVRVGDALTADLGAADAVVGNLPYSSATPILVRLLKGRVPRVVAMVQNEVAERLGATPGPGTYGRLSILAQLFCEVELFQAVPANSFFPVPAVESRIVRLTARADPLAVRSVARLEESVRILFSSRRKQLGNLLPRLTERPDEVAERAGWPADWRRRRPEELRPEAFYALANALT